LSHGIESYEQCKNDDNQFHSKLGFAIKIGCIGKTVSVVSVFICAQLFVLLLHGLLTKFLIWFICLRLDKKIKMVKELSKTALGRLRIVAFIEGCSYLLLGFTMILKYKYLIPEPNYIVGLAHVILFVLYIFLLLQVSFLHRWNMLKIFWAFLASLIPFGTFYADKAIFRQSN
jgi:integral membrane protein